MTFRPRHVLPLATLLIVGPRAGTAVAAEPGPDVPAPSGSWPSQASDYPERRTGAEHEHEEHFRIGAIGGVGFPRPLAIEGLIKLERTLALGAEYSVLPTVTISGVETSFWAVAADARLFPFGGAFFVGLKAGRQHLGVHGTVSVSQVGTLTESVAVDTTFLNPRLGFLWTWSPGVTLGIDAGVQIPIASTASNTLPSELHLNQDVNDVANRFGKTTLPTVDLLRIGFLL